MNKQDLIEYVEKCYAMTLEELANEYNRYVLVLRNVHASFVHERNIQRALMGYADDRINKYFLVYMHTTQKLDVLDVGLELALKDQDKIAEYVNIDENTIAKHESKQDNKRNHVKVDEREHVSVLPTDSSLHYDKNVYVGLVGGHKDEMNETSVQKEFGDDKKEKYVPPHLRSKNEDRELLYTKNRVSYSKCHDIISESSRKIHVASIPVNTFKDKDSSLFQSYNKGFCTTLSDGNYYQIDHVKIRCGLSSMMSEEVGVYYTFLDTDYSTQYLHMKDKDVIELCCGSKSLSNDSVLHANSDSRLIIKHNLKNEESRRKELYQDFTYYGSSSEPIARVVYLTFFFYSLTYNEFNLNLQLDLLYEGLVSYFSKEIIQRNCILKEKKKKIDLLNEPVRDLIIISNKIDGHRRRARKVNQFKKENRIMSKEIFLARVLMKEKLENDRIQALVDDCDDVVKVNFRNCDDYLYESVTDIGRFMVPLNSDFN